MAGSSSSSGTARDVKMRISWSVDSNPLYQANQQIDNSINATKKLSDAIDSAKKSQDEFNNSTKQTDNEQKQNSQQIQGMTDKIKSLNQQLELSKSALKAQTSGLSEIGRGSDAVKIKASELSNIFDLQRQKVQALRDRYAEMRASTNASADALHNMQVKINDETAALGKLQGQLVTTSAEARRARASFVSLTDKLGNFGSNYMLTVSAPIAAGLGVATKAALTFGQQMQDTRKEIENQGYSAKEVDSIMNQMANDSKTWSSRFGKSTDEVNAGILDVTRDGYNAKQVLGMMPAMLAASKASTEDLKTVTVATTATLEQFGQKTHDVGQVISDNNAITNGFVAIANKSKATIGDLGEAFSQMGATAHANNQSIADMAAAVGELKSNGIDASQAGNSLKSGMVNLVNPTKQMAAALKDMKVQVNDAHGAMLPIPTIIDEMRKGTEHMTQSQKNADIATIVGKENLAAWSVLINQGTDHLRELSKEYTDSAGAAQKLSDKMNNTPLAKIKQFQASVHTLSVDFGDKVLPILTPMVQRLTDMINSFDKLNGGAKQSIIYGGLIVAAGVPFIVMLGNIAGGALKIMDAIDRSKAKFSSFRKDMVESAAAAEVLAKAETDAANAGSGIGGSGGLSSSGKKGGFFSRIFRRGGSSAAAAGETIVKDASKGSKFLRFAGTAGKLIGGATIVGDIATSATSLYGINSQNAGGKIGDFSGTLAGGAIGATIGSMIAPGIGTAVGGALGSWLGSKGGEYIGNALQHASSNAPAGKLTAGQVTMMNAGMPYQTAIKAKTDPSLQMSKNVKSLVNDYNSASKTISSTLNALSVTGAAYSKKAAEGIDNAYNSIVKDAKSAASAQEGATKSRLSMLVKEGLMSKSAADQDIQAQHNRYKTNISLAQDAAKQLQKLNSQYYDKMKGVTKQEEDEISAVKKKYTDKNGVISEAGEKKIAQIEQKYADQRRKISQKFSSDRVALEKTLKSDVSGVLSASAAQQKMILGKLRDDSGKLSLQQASDIIKQAKSAKDGAISAANEKYKSVMKAADQEYYVTGSISKSQYEDIKKKAEQQRDDSVKAANEQWNGTVNAAKSQAKGYVDQINWQTGQVLGFWQKMGKGISDAWNWLTKLFTGKAAGVSFNYNWTYGNSSNHAYAKGTMPGGHPGGDAILGDGGKPELWITPQGNAGISPAIPTLYQNMPAGTQVLNGDDTERALGMRAYADGTGGFWSTIGEFLGKGFDWLKNGAASATNWVLNKFGLGNIGNLGDLTKFTQDTAWPAVKNMMGSALSNLAHSFDMSPGASGSAKAWIPIISQAANLSGIQLNGSMINAIVNRIQKESGGNQTIVQKIQDVNSRAGHPAQGLLQYIPSTFSSWARPGHTNILSGFDQLLAMFNDSNWLHDISMPGGWGPTGHRRYANGTAGSSNLLKNFLSPEKKNNQQPQTNVALNHSNRVQSINPTFNITINVNGNEKGMNEMKIARLVREELENWMKNLRTTFDPGVEY